jgi:hypothetical protein
MKFWTCSAVGALLIVSWTVQGCSREPTVRGKSLFKAEQPSAAEESTISTDCIVAAGSAAFKQAVCAHDPQLIRNALFELRDEQRTQAIDVLYSIWIESDEAGKSLPWDELKHMEFRLAYAPALVQSVRSGSKSLPLEPFQNLAVEGATKNVGNLEEIEAIRLMGLANAEAQLPFLLRKIEEKPSPYASRLTAIEALGYICGQESLHALERIRNALADDAKDRQAVDKAFQHRNEISGTWCR